MGWRKKGQAGRCKRIQGGEEWRLYTGAESQGGAGPEMGRKATELNDAAVARRQGAASVRSDADTRCAEQVNARARHGD